jgi:tetratricopeptide (TPR) repeat protein
MTLGIVHESLGEDDFAVDAYEAAIHVEPQVTGPRTNLAAVCDRLAEAADRRAQQAAMMRNAGAGTKAIEQAAEYRAKAAGLRREELDCLARDAALVPDNGAIQYRLGMLLYLHRRMDEAESALRRASELEPNNPQFLLGLVLFYQHVGRYAEALPLAEQLVGLRPEDAVYRKVLEDIRNQTKLP